MKIYQTQCLLLRSVNLTESDKVVSCLSKDLGVIRLVAKGARRLKSRFSGRLEPFTIAEIIYTQREDSDLGYIRQIELEQSYFHLAGRLDLLAAFAYFADLLGEFAPPHEPNENLYRMAKACFAALAEIAAERSKIEIGVLYFELWLLRLGGFLPEATVCADCNREITADETVSWLNNRFLCERCGGGKGTILNSEQIRLMRLARRQPPLDFIERVAAGGAPDLEPLTLIARRLIKNVLLRDPVYWSKNLAGENPGR